MHKHFKIEEHIILEEANLLAVNKPSGMLSIPDREGHASLKDMLQEKYGVIFTVHRLDKDTSGLIVFARNETMHRYLSQQFQNRETTKIYTGLVMGSPFQTTGIIDEPIAEHPVKKGVMVVNRKGKEAITEYEVLESYRLFSWMQFRIHTGRTHQIRVHMKHLGHPIACDELYGDGKPIFISDIKHNYKLSKNSEAEIPIVNRLALHASLLSFTGPDNKEYNLEAPLPKDLKAVLNQLQKTNNNRGNH
jgi:23S rRNA pseudouridine955/2504/2580 synthase/23S rRNA pseudouridine1911/1915/1917 synthase